MVDGACRLDELFGPRDWFVILSQKAEPCRVRGDRGGDIQIAVVGCPAECGAQIGQFDSEPVVGLTLAGAVPQGQDVGFPSGEVAASARPASRSPRHWRRVVPRRTGGSFPASNTGSAPMTGRRPAATCAPAHPADPGWRSRRGVWESRYGAGALQVESTGEHRTPIQQRLFRVVEEVVGPRDGVAQGLVAFQTAPRPTSSRNR